MLDSGTTGIYLAGEYFDGLVADLGLKKDTTNPDGFPIINCDRRADNLNASIDFTFGAGVIKVPFANLILPRSARGGDCMLTIGSAGDADSDGDVFSILGCECHWPVPYHPTYLPTSGR